MFFLNFCKLYFCYVSKDIDVIFVGDDLLEKVICYYEIIDMNMVWEIIDWYK